MTDWRPRIRKIEPEGRGLLQYANALLKQRRFEDAAISAESYVAANPKSGAGLTTLGLCYAMQKRYRAATEVLERAVAAEPLLPQPVMAAGYVHFLQRDYDKAEQAFREALNLDPDLPGASIGLSQVYLKRGDPGRAREIMVNVASSHPELKAARLLLAFLDRAVGRNREATANVEGILGAAPGQAGVVALMPMLFTYQTEESSLDETMRLLRGALRFRPDNAAARTLLGEALLQSHQFAEAEAEFRRALSQRSALTTAQIGLAEALSRQNRHEEAREILASIPRRARLAPTLLAATGDLDLRRGDYGAAIQNYVAALLQTAAGKEAVAALNKETADADLGLDIATRYQSAAHGAFKRAKHARTEDEWNALARRVAHAGWKWSKSQSRREASSGGTVV